MTLHIQNLELHPSAHATIPHPSPHTTTPTNKITMSLSHFPSVVSRFIRPTDGKIAILISPGHGNGWSTACLAPDVETAIFDADIVAAVLARDWRHAATLAEAKIPGFVAAGAQQLVVAWMDPGEEFWIGGLGGHEFIVQRGGVGVYMGVEGKDEGREIFMVA